MATDTSFHFGKNLITVTPEKIILKKTKRSKALLVFWNVVLFSIIAFTLSYLIILNRTHLKFPSDFFDRLLAIAALVGFLYFVFHTVRESINECNAYVFDLNHSQVVVNSKPFGEGSLTELKIIKSVGWDGLGESYKICLAAKRRRKIISFGNSLQDAKETASIISHHLKLKVTQIG